MNHKENAGREAAEEQWYEETKEGSSHMHDDTYSQVVLRLYQLFKVWWSIG